MSEHRYSGAAMKADFIRAGAGSALTLGPLLLVPATPVMSAVLGGLGILFVAFGARTWTRHRSRILADDENVTVRALRVKKITWKDMTSLQLRYYAARRDRARGWMQLTLKSRDTRLCLESTLDGFDRIADLAARAARRNGIAMSPATLENLRALGLSATGSSGKVAGQPAAGEAEDR